MSRYVPGQLVIDKLRDITEMELKHKTFGAPPGEPLLGQYFKLPVRPERQDPIVLDDSLATVSHLLLLIIISFPNSPGYTIFIIGS